MNLSVNELDTLAKRAARGAGYSWGLAEEAGKAVRWLCANDLDGIAQLSLLLECQLSVAIAKHRPQIKDDAWQASERLCPLITGAYLSDAITDLSDESLYMRHMVAPSILLPFVANLAVRNRQNYSIKCDDATAVTDGSLVSLDRLFADHATAVIVSPGGLLGSAKQQHARVFADIDHLQILNRYASETYAPESDQSRLLGAGAGLSDND